MDDEQSFGRSADSSPTSLEHLNRLAISMRENQNTVGRQAFEEDAPFSLRLLPGPSPHADRVRLRLGAVFPALDDRVSIVVPSRRIVMNLLPVGTANGVIVPLEWNAVKGGASIEGRGNLEPFELFRAERALPCPART